MVDFSIRSPFWTQWRTYLPTLIFTTIVFTLIGRLFINRRHTAQLRNEMSQKEEAEIQRIRAELDEAQNIQMGLLPTESPDTKGFDIAGMSVPATQVGGDFYDYLTVENGHTAIAVADAAGKGLRGAMNAVLTNGMLHEVARFRSSADAILTDLNAGLAPRMYGPSFIKNHGLETPSFRLGRKVRPRVLGHSVFLKKHLTLSANCVLIDVSRWKPT